MAACLSTIGMCPPATGMRSSAGTGNSATASGPFIRAATAQSPRELTAQGRGQVAQVAFAKIILLDTTPELAANFTLSWKSLPSGPDVKWLSRTKRHAPVPVRPDLPRFRVAFAVAAAPVPQAAARTGVAARGCVTEMTTTSGRPGSSAGRSPGSGHTGSAGEAAVPQQRDVQQTVQSA